LVDVSGRPTDAMRALVTGGAGFIGSNLVLALQESGHEVRVLDDLSTGLRENVDPAIELLVGRVTDEDMVRKAVDGVDVVFHHAAARAVLMSVEHPLATDFANTHGTLTVLKAAVDAGATRVVYASSSSVYGGADVLPTPESAPTLPRSPYAVSKLAGEHYCRVFSELYGLETVVLRYFNVFGPRQRPDSAYAAVIPLFIDALNRGEPATVHGDGQQTRDFTFVSNVVAANLAAATVLAERCSGGIYNIAGGAAHSLLELLEVLGRVMHVKPTWVHTEPRPGDIRHSLADVSASQRDLGYVPTVDFESGLARTVTWFVGA
jgi:UDP-glucose 4-epimerase